MTDTGGGRVAAWADGVSSRLVEWFRAMHPLRRAGAVLGLIGAIVAATLIALGVGQRSAEEARVYERYNDALVERDLGLAWSLGCLEDRTVVTLADFTLLYEQATAPLGPLRSWNRLRGGAEWNGAVESLKARPAIEKVDDQYCVRLGGSPLGDPF